MSGLDPNAESDFAPGLDAADTGASFAEGLEPAADPSVARRSALANSARLASSADPTQHANVLQMADRLKLAPSVVERNPEDAKSVLAQRNINADSVTMHSPALADWLSNYDNMAVAQGDIRSLQGLEWWLGRTYLTGKTKGPFNRPEVAYSDGAISHAVNVGNAQRELSDIGLQAMLSGTDPTSNPRFNELNAFVSQDYGKKAHGTFGRMATGTLESLASLTSGLVQGAKMGAFAAGTAAVAGQVGPQALLPEEVITVPTAFGGGMLVGVGLDTFRQEAGGAYIDIVNAMKERGGRVDFNAAAMASVLVGTLNGLLEVGGTAFAATLFPVLAPFLGEGAAEAAGKVPLHKAVARAVTSYLGTLTEETATEIAQQGVTSVARETTVGATGGRTDFATIPGELGDTAIESALSFAGLVLPGPLGQFAHDIHGMKQGLEAGQRLESLGALAQDTNLASIAPGKMEEFVDGAAQRSGHPDSVLVSADAWTTLFQSKGENPATAATQIGIGDEYAAAKETGGFVAIPLGTYTSEIASNKEYSAALAPDSKLYQDSMTPREAEDHQKVLDSLSKSMGEETAAAAKKSPIYQDRFNQLRAVGVSETDANHYARLHEAYFKTQAARTGLSVEELQTAFPLSIEAGPVEAGPDITVDPNGAIRLSQAVTPTGKIGKWLSRFGVTPREGPFTITLAPNADRSTFLHETGHYFLETFADLAYRDSATDQTRADYEKLLGWFGVKSRDEVTANHHERFARAFEAYLEDGKAPSRELVRPFARFSAWLKSIYRKIGGLGVGLSLEVRGVMDRMLATDEAISGVEQSSAYIPMFRSAAEAGMSEAAFAEYQNKAEAAHVEAQRVLGARIATDQRRETESWWREEKAKVADEVLARINAERPVQAYRYFAEGKIPEGADRQVFADEKGDPFKLSSTIIASEYPGISESVRKELGRTGLTTIGGAHPDAVAPLFGYASGDELLQALVTQAQPDRRIASETNRIMVERHGDVLHDGTLPQAAEEASRDSKTRLSQLLQELDALNRKAGNRRVKLTETDLKASAFESIWAGKVRDVDPGAYQRAERTAATRAIQAAGKGRYDEAVDWQRRRLLNFALAREAATAKKEVASAAKFLQNSGKDAARAKLGKAGFTYQEQQDALLERFDFRKRSLTAIDKSSSLAEWVTTQQQAGFDPIVPQKLLNDAFRTNWKDMTVRDLLGLRDAVKSIQHQADRKNSLIVAGKKRGYEDVISHGVEAIQKNVPDPGRAKISEIVRGAVERFAKFGHAIDAEMVKLESLADQFDGGDPNGIYAQMLVHNLADAQAAEKDQMLLVAKKFLKAQEALSKEDKGLLQGGTIYLSSIEQTMSYRDLLGVAANYGNESNYKKLLLGYQTTEGGLIPWTTDTIEEAVGHLTKAHWDYIQAGGDLFKSLWPESQALERRLTGLAPPEVERRSFTKFGKTYEGYYYPLIPHPLFSKILAEKMTGPDGGPWAQSYVSAVTSHRHLIERTEAAYPLSLDILRMPSQIAQVIHDTTHREPINEAWRFLTDQRIAAEIKHRMGLPYYKAMLERLRRVAGNRGMSDTVGNVMAEGQAALAASVMGWKATVTMQNFANVAVAKQVVGVLPFAKAINEIARGPVEVISWIKENSGEMRHRMTTRENQLRIEYERGVSGDSWATEIRRSGYMAASFTNALTEYPMFLAQYRDSVAAGLSHEESVRAAEAAVRINLGAGGVKDLANFQDHQWLRYLTMFSGWFNSQYQTQRKIYRETKNLTGERRYAAAAHHAISNEFWRVAVMAVASEILSGRGPDDGENAWEWALEQIALYHASMIPGIKDLAVAYDRNQDPRFFGLQAMGDLVLRAVKADAKAGHDFLHGHPNLSFVGPNAKLAATVMGLPAAQADITGGFLWDVAQGRYRYRGLPTALHDLIFRRDTRRR